MPRGEKSAELRLRTFVAQIPLGSFVRLAVADDFCLRGMVTHVTFGPGYERYGVTWGDHSESDHYPIELRIVLPDDDELPDAPAE